jgi:hypothetical protein
MPAFSTCAALTLAWAAFQPQHALAQQPCTAITNDAERLACYDRALRGAPPAPAPRAAAPAAPAAAAVAPASTTLTTEDRASRRERRAREAEAAAAATAPATSPTPATPAAVDPIAPAPGARSAATAAAPAAAAPAQAAAAPADLAVRHTAKTTEKAGIVPIVVVQVRGLQGRPTTFVTDSGDTWIQTDSNRLQLPATPFKASIEPGAMSSSFLVLNDHGRAIRVRHAE